MRAIIAFLLTGPCWMTCFPQENLTAGTPQASTTDSLTAVISSPRFTLEEEYIGDWGGYLNSFVFTSTPDDVRVLWKGSEVHEYDEGLDLRSPLAQLHVLAAIFNGCRNRIPTSEKRSTEHIFYRFRNGDMTYVIDDEHTMECHDEFKKWKEMLLKNGKQREKEKGMDE